MTSAEAFALVMEESTGEKGMIVALRQGDDPGPERTERLLAAMRVLFDDARGKVALDRRLAYALHELAMQIEAQVGSWETRGRTWREALIDEEVPALALAVESLFADDWHGD